jgi:glycerol-3-phosphate O-acyltransferase
MLKSFDPKGGNDIVFVPVALNYDRVLEDRTLLRALDREARRRSTWFVLTTTLGFWLGQLGLMLRGRWFRFGYACVNFGAPVSMREYCTLRGLDFQKLQGEQRKRAIGDLGTHLMSRVGGIVPVVPVPLIATVLLANSPNPISEFELKAAVEQLIEKLEAAGAHVYIPRKDLDYAVTVGLRMLTLRHVVEEKEGLFVGRAPDLPLIRYYANSIAHLLR